MPDAYRTGAVLAAGVLLLAAVGSGAGALVPPASGDESAATVLGSARAATQNATATPTSDGANVTLLTAAVAPSTVTPGTVVTDQRVAVYAAGVSADGEADTAYIAFPNALAANLSVAAATVSGNATVLSTGLVDGFDGDGVTDTVAVETDATGGGTVPFVVALNVSTYYPNASATYPVDVRLVDSTGATTTERAITAVAAARTGTAVRTENASGSGPPVITDFRLNATEQDVDVVVSSTEDLEKLKVKVKGKTKNVTLTRADFSETTTSASGAGTRRFVYDQDVDVFLNNTTTGDVGKLKVKVKSKVKKIRFAYPGNRSQQRYVYRADVSNGSDGTFNAELVRASSDGEEAVVGQRDQLTVATPLVPTPDSFTTGFVIGALTLVLAGAANRRRDTLAAWLSTEE